MVEPRCDFYDWSARRRCDRPARWVTYQRSLGGGPPARYYCDAHRPPRAHRITALSTEKPRALPEP